MSTSPRDGRVTSRHPGIMSRLRRGELGRFVRFGIVGGSGVVVNQVVLALFFYVLLIDLSLGLRAGLATLAGILVSIFTNFLLNDSWTWGDRPKHGRQHWVRRSGAFFVTSLLAVVIQWVVTMALSQWILTWNILLANLVGIACGVPPNFVVNNLWTFSHKARPPQERQNDQ